MMFLIFTMKQSGAQGRNVRHESATRSNESHGTEMQGTAYQSNADCPLATAGFPSRFGSKAGHGMASHSNGVQGTAVQSNADCPLATAGFPSRFGSGAAHRNAAQIIARHIKATRTAHWQQWVFRVVLARRQGVASTRIARQCKASKGSAMQCGAFQSNAHRGLATDFSAGRFGLLGGFSSALSLT